jgi:hypothetical protein
MTQSRHQEAGDEVAEVLDLLARLRARFKEAGPMVTSRIWKAEMQMKKLASELATTCPAGGSPLQPPKKSHREAVRANAARIRRLCRHPRTGTGNDPLASITPIRQDEPAG